VATFTSLTTFILLPLLLLWGILLWASESRQQRIQRWHRSGLSQRAIAGRLQISRYAVGKALAA
jgi:hypothetical protein